MKLRHKYTKAFITDFNLSTLRVFYGSYSEARILSEETAKVLLDKYTSIEVYDPLEGWKVKEAGDKLVVVYNGTTTISSSNIIELASLLDCSIEDIQRKLKPIRIYYLRCPISDRITTDIKAVESFLLAYDSARVFSYDINQSDLDRPVKLSAEGLFFDDPTSPTLRDLIEVSKCS